MNAVEQAVAGVVLVVCMLMLVRLSLGSVRRYRFDAFWRRAFRPVARAGAAAKRTGSHLWQTVFLRRARERAAAREAAEAIERARKRDADWQGNVYTPRSFRRPKKPH